MVDYKLKYLKYKLKYLDLKKNLTGGGRGSKNKKTPSKVINKHPNIKNEPQIMINRRKLNDVVKPKSYNPNEACFDMSDLLLTIPPGKQSQLPEEQQQSSGEQQQSSGEQLLLSKEQLPKTLPQPNSSLVQQLLSSEEEEDEEVPQQKQQSKTLLPSLVLFPPVHLPDLSLSSDEYVRPKAPSPSEFQSMSP